MTLRRSLIALVLGAWLVPGAARADEVRLGTVLTSGCSVVKLFERCELTVEVEGPVKNPYDPDEVTLEAVFRPDQGSPVTVYGFYDEPFERVVEDGRETIRSAGSPVWKVRFTPRQLGRWSATLTVVTPKGRRSSAPQPFLVISSARQGFVLLDRNEGNFRFETGKPFIPIGENLCWGARAEALRDYDRWLDELARQRANYIRVWMAPWFLRLETKDTGVGRYDQLRAWQLDYLFDKSERRGIFWQLCLLNHGSFSRTQDPDWDNNPYNAQLGGMCRLPNEFLTDPLAKKVFQRLLRYIVNRWGYSPQLVTWELFNEADFGEFQAADLAAWIDQMSRFLAALDVNQRPITTSFHGDAPPGVWGFPKIDVIQLHMYDQRDFAQAFGGPAVSRLGQAFHKPVFIGEFGWIDEFVRKADDVGIHLHDGLWAGVMGGASGGALPWYWDSYIHPNQLERHFRPLEAFLRDEQLHRDMKPVAVSVSDHRLTGWGIGRADRAYLWLKNRAHTVDQYLTYRCQLAKDRIAASRGQGVTPAGGYAPQPVRGGAVTVRGVNWNGRYRIEWWDPYRGRVAGRSAAEARGGALTLAVPDVRFDVAAKLIRLQWWERVAAPR